MEKDKIAILGVPIDDLTMDEAVESVFHMIDQYADDYRPRAVATVNVDFMVNTQSWDRKKVRHPELLDTLRSADMVTADGMPIVWASRMLGRPLKQRVAGADLIPRLAEEAAKHGKAIYFLGGRGDSGERAARLLEKRYPGLKIAGVCSPFVHIDGHDLLWAEEEDLPIIEQINRSGADILLIGFGNPKQELWFRRNRDKLKVPVSIGIGGTYDFITGSIARAPIWMQNAGLEWLFRITQDPRRLWKRYLVGFFKFGIIILPAILYYYYKRALFNMLHRYDPLPQKRDSAPVVSDGNYIKVIMLPERLDASFVNDFRDEIEKGAGLDRITVLDFNATSFIDSSGLGLLVRLHRQSSKGERSLYMIRANRSVMRFFEYNRLMNLFQPIIHANLKVMLSDLKETESLPSFYYSIEPDKNFVLIRLFGRLDAAQMSNLDMSSIFEEIGYKNCILNLGNLNFMDSRGLIFLLKIQKYLSTLNKVCLLCSLTDTVMQMLRITRLTRFFQIAPDITSASARLEVPQ